MHEFYVIENIFYGLSKPKPVIVYFIFMFLEAIDKALGDILHERVVKESNCALDRTLIKDLSV